MSNHNYSLDHQNLIGSSDEQVTNEIEHIFLYLSNFKPMEEENSDGEIIRYHEDDSDSDYLTTNDEEYVDYRSEIVGQMSEFFEKRRSDSSSFVVLYNNVHYLKEPVVFGNILDFYFKPTDSDYDPMKKGVGASDTFLHFLTLRQVCKYWKKFIDEKYGRSFILSVLQDRVKYQDCNPNTDICLFRLCGLPIALTLLPVLLVCKYFPNNQDAIIYSGWISFRLAWLIISGCPVLVPAVCCGTLVDLAIAKMRERRFYKRLEGRYENMEHNIMSEMTYFEKCELISTIQDSESKFNNHSCYYIIEVTINVNGKLLGYQIQKKYTQFKSLYDAMCKCIKSSEGILQIDNEQIEFPSKRWSIFNNPEEIIHERKIVFQRMLNLIISHQDTFHSSEIYSFFYDRKNQQAILGQTATENGEEEGFLFIESA